MNKAIWLAGLTGLVIGSAGTSFVLVGSDGTIPAVPSATVMAPPQALTQDAIEALLQGAEPAERARLLASDEAFAEFVEQEARNQAIVRSAYAKALDADPAVAVLMRRAGQRVLAEAHLREIIAAQGAALAPTPEQARAYYEAHPDEFRLPERVHLWQIFLPATSSTERQNAQALGRQLLEKLLAGEADLATLAARHSGHPQSRLNGGYMGLIPLPDLKPEIRQAVENIAPGELSGPVETADGFHVIRRGEAVPGTHLPFEESAPRIETFLRRQALAEARAAAVARAVEEHPVTFDTANLPAWRSALRQKFPDAPVAGDTAAGGS
ncbi:MAG: peptidyl-prolyl cis-trans isomerase [Gammaproteobacteria bacterium]